MSAQLSKSTLEQLQRIISKDFQSQIETLQEQNQSLTAQVDSLKKQLSSLKEWHTSGLALFTSNHQLQPVVVEDSDDEDLDDGEHDSQPQLEDDQDEDIQDEDDQDEDIQDEDDQDEDDQVKKRKSKVIEDDGDSEDEDNVPLSFKKKQKRSTPPEINMFNEDEPLGDNSTPPDGFVDPSLFEIAQKHKSWTWGKVWDIECPQKDKPDKNKLLPPQFKELIKPFQLKATKYNTLLKNMQTPPPPPIGAILN